MCKCRNGNDYIHILSVSFIGWCHWYLCHICYIPRIGKTDIDRKDQGTQCGRGKWIDKMKKRERERAQVESVGYWNCTQINDRSSQPSFSRWPCYCLGYIWNLHSLCLLFLYYCLYSWCCILFIYSTVCVACTRQIISLDVSIVWKLC